MADASYSRRNWFGLIFAVVILLIPCCWLVVKMQHARRQHEAIEEIVKGEGWASYDYKLTETGSLLPEAEPPKATWLRAQLGDDFFHSVVCAYVRTDAAALHLKELGDLRILSLDSTQVTDAGLVGLHGLTCLSTLNFYHVPVSESGFARLPPWAHQCVVTVDSISGLGPKHESSSPKPIKISDAGLVHLRGLKQLERLWLANSPITDAGLENLKGLDQLCELNLDHTEIVGTALEHLGGLKQLKYLSLTDTKVDDAGLVHLQKLNRLIDLRLDHTRVTDTGLMCLKGLSQLQVLSLGGTKVTDQGVTYLEGLRQLERLYLYDTLVKQEGVKKLQQALPDCKIER